MPVPVQQLATTGQYLTVLDGHEPKFRAGERFAYCNSGYVVLALIGERVTSVPFPELVRKRVCAPAKMEDTEFLRSDELPRRTALGYLDAEGSRTKVFHLPVRGSGDGGIYATVEDVARLWRAFFAGRIVSVDWVAEMVRLRSPVAKDTRGYGLGFWLDRAADSVILTGSDAGVSFRTEYRPREDSIVTVISNITHRASAMARRLGPAWGGAP
jgi:CubicO group peptidase (beta-lactamase class C family)